MTHDLKVWPEYMAAIKNGSKRFELRKNDRNYALGDILALREWDPIKKSYVVEDEGDVPTPFNVVVTYMLAGSFGLPDDTCVMSFVPINETGCSCDSYHQEVCDICQGISKPWRKTVFPDGPWSYEWHGSGEDRGYTLKQGREKISYVGDQIRSSDMQDIAWAHNVQFNHALKMSRLILRALLMERFKRNPTDSEMDTHWQMYAREVEAKR